MEAVASAAHSFDFIEVTPLDEQPQPPVASRPQSNPVNCCFLDEPM